MSSGESVQPGPVAVFGSGETAPEAQRVHDALMRRVNGPIRACVLETPAGFELNSADVAGRLATFVREHLPNYRPEVTVIPARRRGTAFSPDDPEVARPVLAANYVLAGPGSPTYAARQLRDSLVWQAAVARHRIGGTLVFASAMSVAISRQAIPVYEIYKAGHDLHWTPGLDLFGPYGLRLTFVPHWNNSEGGATVDTSHCFMGAERFGVLRGLMEPGTVLVGIDEHTALTIDLAAGKCQVWGLGTVTVLGEGREFVAPPGGEFPLSTLGEAHPIDPSSGLRDEVWRQAIEADAEMAAPPAEPTTEVLDLLDRRNEARARRDWQAADQLRARITELGWQIADSPTGSSLSPAAAPSRPASDC